MRVDEVYDLIVIGGGVMGSWTAIAAAQKGASVVLADQYTPAHENGSSHGDGRIYRLAYTEDIYVDMMERSLPRWRELQDFAGEPLLHQTGGLNIAEKDNPDPQYRLDELGDLYARRGITHEWLSAGEVNERYPQYKLDETLHALWQPDYGVLLASKCVMAAWEYAKHLGVTTKTGFKVANVRTNDETGIVVEARDGAVLRGKAIVLALGPWLTPYVSSWLGFHIPTTVSAETVCYYAPKKGAPDHSYKSMPVFIPELNNGLGPFGYYGLPMIDIPGIKASAHYCGPVVHPDFRPESAGGNDENLWDKYAKPPDGAARARVDEVIESTSRYIASTFPHVEHTPFTTQSCLYTTTPDHDYILSKAPSPYGERNVVLAGGGSGHAFKMGPAIGEAAASLALKADEPFDLERFDVTRLLKMKGQELDHEASGARK